MENIKRILLVEDEFIIAKDIKITLEKYAKIKVDTAKNFKQAYELFSNNDYQLLLTDINLNEEKDGIDVASQLKEIKSIPVVFLTAYSDQEIINKAKKVLPFAYLLKPFDEVQLKVTIDLAILNYKKEVEGIEEVARYSEQIEELTKREKQVLIVLASGKTAKETGDNLNISAHTVEVHKKNIKKKLHMNTMSELINFALSSKLYEVS